mmetsp:Transcript_9441/g.34653  ORF Transcript_9441/g.34653 Transcript_9441/m.34653 type:complete len:337 (-) Transcript_9441:24-1034(-)
MSVAVSASMVLQSQTVAASAVKYRISSASGSSAPSIVRFRSNRRTCVRCKLSSGERGNGGIAAAAAAVGTAAAVAAVHTGAFAPLASAAELLDAASSAAVDAAAIAPGELVDETLSDFNVEFAGGVWDHKTIVFALIFGQWVGFIGALVGGNSARVRKEEVEQLNQKLLQVNQQLREYARKSKRGLYSSGEVAAANGELQTADWLVELKKGKSLLKDREGEQAKVSFERALVLLRSAEGLKTPWKAERKALRGLSAAHRLMGEKQVALEYILKVLDLCDTHGDTTGKGDALGVIADLYTDIGDFDKAAQYYDLYLAEIGEAMEAIDVDPSNTQVSV